VLIAIAMAAPLILLWGWARLPGPGSGTVIELEIGANDVSQALQARGAIQSPRLFRAYLGLLRPTAAFAPGPHVLDDGLSPNQIVDRLARSRFRPKTKVTLVEGFHQQQVLRRLEQQRVIARTGPELGAELRRELSITGASLEGYWSPATWDLFVNADPKELARLMVRSTRKRIDRVSQRHPGALEALQRTRGWGEHEVLTLASIVEKETAHPDERALVASVYFNRLDDPDFVPRGRLQADPTAAYPCQVGSDAPRPASCSDWDRTGRVSPRMLRDGGNRYNTYVHAGLPPGPICSPSEAALEAVLAPAKTDYLFFVASGGGRHHFSRTFDEHQRAIDKTR